MISDPNALRTLFRQATRHIGLQSNLDLVPLDAAVSEMVVSFQEIYGVVVPSLARMTGNGPTDIDRFLDVLADLKTEFEHLKLHLLDAIPCLDALIDEASKAEQRRSSGH
jgi:hypothetical protein